jgi:methanogenic corrinoid protein MtbC1
MKSESLSYLKKAVLEYEPETAVSWAQKAIDEGIDPLAAMDALIEAMREVGEGFGRGDLFLPDLTGAAEAMQAATPTIEKAIKARGAARKTLGKVVIGTVAGDIHTIGKSMVTTMLVAEGFEVLDIGIDVSTDRFVAAVVDYQPAILGMSALLTTTAPEAKKVIDRLAEVGLRHKIKVIVGGGAMTEAFAKSMGADGYSPTAPGAVSLCRKMIDV